MHKNFKRSESYRRDFIRHNPPRNGRYRCVYCGRQVKTDHMQVDHVIAVKRVEKNPLYRCCIHEDINELSNLVPACPKCNRKKSDKGGLWILRGKFWKVLLPIHIGIRVFLVAFLIWFVLATLGYAPAIDTFVEIPKFSTPLI